jgi:succinate-acetate transporter protein
MEIQDGQNTSADEFAGADGSDAPRERVMITLRPIGTPTSIGLYGLGAASWALAALQLGWLPPGEGKNVALVLIGFTFAAQLLASAFAFLGRDGTVGTAMGVLALSWLVVGLILHGSRPGAISGALGMFLLFSGTTMLLVSITASFSKLVMALVFGLAAIRFLVAGSYELSGATFWEHTSGVLGLALVVLALYAAFAAGLEDANGHTILPLGRRGTAKLPPDSLDPGRDVLAEPGVRSKL